MPEPRSDIGEETARFQAFQEQGDDLPAVWHMRAPGSKIALLAVVVIVVAILAVVLGKILMS
jgi:hypothetical protein